MKLVIVESPAKAKTIEKYLGDGYTVRASVGHIRDLPKSNKDAIDIEAGFVPRYQIVPEKRHIIKDLRALSERCDETILATDPDREGEAIAWHLAESIGLRNPNRIVFHEITKNAIQEALVHPRRIDQNLRQAQEARRVLDRLFGYGLSGLVWKKVRYGLSAGRVQSPALRILMEREREIREFVPIKYWIVEATLATDNGEQFVATCIEEPTTEEVADTLVSAAKKGKWQVISVEESEQNRSPRAPFTTSTLQQTASTRFGFSPKRTMQLAQRLYEAGHITYMRTDSTNLASVAQSAIIATARSEYGDKYISPRTYKTKSKSAQEAHEAVRPTNPRIHNAGNDDDQKKLYSLIRARALASQMSDARVLRTKIITNIANASTPHFSTTGSRVIFDGWLAADPGARGEDTELPQLKSQDSLRLVEAHFEAKETQPPARYSEAGLVKELEKRGIGRPSTYASIISTLEAREYVIKQGRTLLPTATGDVVSTFVENNFTSYISDSFTAEMEDELDEIANGEREYTKTLQVFWIAFEKAIKDRESIAKVTGMGDVPSEFACMVCNGPMEYKLSRNGRFMSCKNFPTCMGARREDGTEIPPPKELGEICPLCGEKKEGKLIEREGRFGRFIGCSNYNNKKVKCKFIKKDPSEEARANTGITCPICQQGKMTERRGRFGLFYSCSRYPDCKYAIKAKPTGNTCSICSALMMEGTKTIPERCSDKKCPNHNPHKKKN